MPSPYRTRHLLRWEARPSHELLRLAGPIAVSMVSHAFMSLVDTFCVARLGASALAGVGIGSVAFFTLAGFGFGFFRGSKTLIAQAHGAGKSKQVARHMGAAILGALGVGALVSIGLVTVSAALPSIVDSIAAGHAARTYSSTLAMAGIPAMLYVALRESRYGVGDSKTPMRAALAANAVNIGLDVLLVWVLDFGVQGAAMATVAAYLVQLICMVPRRRDLRRPRRVEAQALLRIGTPTGVQFVLEIGSFALLAAMISSMGEHEMAAHQVALQLMHFVFLPVVALGEACSVMSGQALGAQRKDLIGRVARTGRRVLLLYSFLWFFVLLAARTTMAAAFTSDLALRDAIAALLLVGAVFQLGDGLAMLASAILRGIGDVKYSAVVGVTTSWVLTPPIAYLLGDLLGLGALGGWIGLTAQFFAQAALLWRRLAKKT